MAAIQENGDVWIVEPEPLLPAAQPDEVAPPTAAPAPVAMEAC